MSASVPMRGLYAGGDAQALALKMFWGEVFGAYRNKTLFYDRIARKTITSGKSWQFIRFGDSQADDAPAPGTELLGNPFGFDEGLVTIDDRLIAHHDIAMADEDISHYDFRNPIATKMGEAMANQQDARIGRLIALAARQTARVITLSDGVTTKQIHPGGVVVPVSGATLAAAFPKTLAGSQKLQESLADVAETWDNRDIPEEGRYAYLSPYLVRVLLLDKTLVNKDYTNTLGDANRRVITEVEGFKIIKYNRLPKANQTTGPTKYRGDFSKTAALCMRDGAIGGVQALGMKTVIQPDERRETTFFKSVMRVGYGVIRPEDCGEIAFTGE